MKKKMMPVDEVSWIVGVGFIIIMIVAAHYMLKPKVIAPSGPGVCDVACCIEIFKKHCKFVPKNSKALIECKINLLKSDLDSDIKKTRRGME